MARPKTKITEKAIERAWQTGNLTYKLLPHQFKLYDAIRSGNQLKYVVNCSRRFGKSSVLSLIAIEDGLRHDDYQIRFAAPTSKMVKKIIQPIFRLFSKDAPYEYQPFFRTTDSVYEFPSTLSECHIAGTDNGNAENLRGTSSNLNIVDEAGFCSELLYVLNDILLPQTLTTQGRTIIASTPPRSVDHDYILIARDAIENNAYVHFTIYDNTSLDKATIDEYAKSSGGYDSTTFQREYLAEFVTDKETQIVPEWKQQVFVQPVERDEFYGFNKKYVAMDIGGSVDKTVVLFGYYDFRQAKLIVEDELVFTGNTVHSKQISEQIKQKETELWGGVYRTTTRIADSNNAILLQDMSLLHDLHFGPTSKDALLAMVNELRLWVGGERILIDPKCTEVTGCLKTGVWKKMRSGSIAHEFARSSVFGHYDALAALIYMVRNIDQHTNPVPATHGMTPDKYYIRSDFAMKNKYQSLEHAFGLGTSKKR